MTIEHFTPSSLLEALKEPARYRDNIAQGWEAAQQCLPEFPPPMLDTKGIADNADWCGLEPEVTKELIRLALRCREIPALRSWLWNCVYQLNTPGSPQEFYGAPTLQQILGDDAGLFYLLVATTIVPLAVANYRNSGIDDQLIRNTLQEVRCFCNNHRIGHNGRPGLLLPQLSWLRFYRDGQIYRLGRLEFKTCHAQNFGVLLRRRSDGIKIALAESGQCFDDRGYCADASTPAAWTAELQEDENQISGYPLNPSGHAVNRRRTFNRREWEVMARTGDEVIDMHIPSGGGLTLAACLDSLCQANAFFARRRPELNLKIIWCHSWIFNPQWQDKLPESNLAKFQRELYLFPSGGPADAGMFFVFCSTERDPSKLPRQTSLQRAMLEIIESGRPLHASAMVLALEDLPRFGTQYYRRTTTDWLS